MAKPVPLTDTFIRNGLAEHGWLTPPSDGPGRSDRQMVVELVCYGCALIIAILCALIYAILMP